MIKKYTLTKVTLRPIAKLRTEVKEAEATDTDGKFYEKITLWKNDWSQIWNDIKDGYELNGEITEKENKGYVNFTLTPERTNTLYPKKNLTAAMETKNQNIMHAQDRKDEGIKISSTFRDATILTAEWMKRTDVPFPTDTDVKAKWKAMRDWLWKQWEYDVTQEPPF